VTPPPEFLARIRGDAAIAQATADIDWAWRSGDFAGMNAAQERLAAAVGPYLAESTERGYRPWTL
jgi:hypothetical protein